MALLLRNTDHAGVSFTSSLVGTSSAATTRNSVGGFSSSAKVACVKQGSGGKLTDLLDRRLTRSGEELLDRGRWRVHMQGLLILTTERRAFKVLSLQWRRLAREFSKVLLIGGALHQADKDRSHVVAAQAAELTVRRQALVEQLLAYLKGTGPLLLITTFMRTFSGSFPSARRVRQNSTTSWLFITSQIPSHARIMNSSSAVILRSWTSG